MYMYRQYEIVYLNLETNCSSCAGIHKEVLPAVGT